MNSQLLNRSISQLLFGSFGVTVLLASLAQVGMAQTPSTADDLHWLDNSSQNAGADGTNGLDMFEMMHRMQQGTIRTQGEFLRDQQRTLGTAAEEFRTQQRRALEQQAETSQPGTVESFPSSTSQPASQPQTP